MDYKLREFLLEIVFVEDIIEMYEEFLIVIRCKFKVLVNIVMNLVKEKKVDVVVFVGYLGVVMVFVLLCLGRILGIDCFVIGVILFIMILKKLVLIFDVGVNVDCCFKYLE